MNLDELISKYIDGELTEYEDDFLRQRISVDKFARKKFDEAINLNIALKEDAKSIVPSIDLVNKTEDIVLMKILANSPEIRKRRAFIWSNASMLAASVLALMFLMVFQISDYTFKNKSKFNHKSKIASLSKTDNPHLNNKNVDFSQPIIKSEKNARQIVRKSNNKINMASTIAGGLVSVNNANKKMIEKDIAMINENNKFELNSFPLPTIIRPEGSKARNIKSGNIKNFNKYMIGKKKIIAYSKSVNNISKNINTNSMLLNTNSNQKIINRSFVGNNNEVQIGSFFGTDIFRTGNNAYSSVISHFSQSVAYAIDSKERLGVELGYTEYVYNEKAIINVKKKMGSLVAGVENNESGFNFTFDYQHSIVLKNSKQIIWASVFYENTFFTSRYWELIARLGLGATNEGPLGYGRIFTIYNLFGSFNLTLGAEGRLYSAELPKFVGDNNKFNASCSLIYGFQFKF